MTQPLRFGVDVVGSVTAILEGYVQAGERAAMGAMRRASDGVKGDLRKATRAAGIKRGRNRGGGQDIFKTWQAPVFPKKGQSIEPAMLVHSKAPNIMIPLVFGATIRARNARWLVIPLKAAERRGLDRSIGGRLSRKRRRSDVTDALAKFPDLRFVPTARANVAFLALPERTARAERIRVRKTLGGRRINANFAPLFLLVRKVRIRPRLRYFPIVRLWARRIPRLVTTRWELELRKATFR